MKYWEISKINRGCDDKTVVSIEIVDKEHRDTSAYFKWNGCVNYTKYNNGFTVDDEPSAERSKNSQYIHICELDEMIERLQEIKKIAKLHFSKEDFDTFYTIDGGVEISGNDDHIVIKPMESNDTCERKDCDGMYKYSFNGGGTCTKCGHEIPCF